MSDKYEITGTIVKIEDERRVNDRLSVKKIVIDTEPSGSKYPNPLPIEFKNNKIANLDNAGVNPGDKVKVGVFMNGRYGKNEKAHHIYLSFVGNDIGHG